MEILFVGVDEQRSFAQLVLVALLDGGHPVLSGPDLTLDKLAAVPVPSCVGIALLGVYAASRLDVLEGLFCVSSFTTLNMLSYNFQTNMSFILTILP